MQQDHPELAIKMTACTAAIGARAILRGTYNGAPVELHPHQLVERNAAVYLRAVNPAKSRRHDEAPALGFFHLSGLTDLQLASEPFEPLADADLAPARPTDRILQTI